MPNYAVHFLLASRVLDRWRETPSDAPFAVADPSARSAFLYGSIAPDLGYFPAGERLVSDLVHRVRSGDMARTLLATARTELQLAYTWGWVTHLLGDLAVHPLINEAGWEAATGRRGRPADAPQDDRSHMRVEFGLDAAFFRRYPRLDALPDRVAFDAGYAEHLAPALGEMYGWRPQAEEVVRWHAGADRAINGSRLLNRMATARLRRRPLHLLGRLGLDLLGRPSRLVPDTYPRAPLLAGILDPVPTRPWLLAEVERVIAGFPETFQHHYASGLRELENYDLALGDVAAPVPTRPLILHALAELERRGGRVRSLQRTMPFL